MNELLASALRSALTAMAIAVTLPLIDTYGIAITHALCAVLLWLSFGYVIALGNKSVANDVQ